MISGGRQQVAKLCFLGHHSFLTLYLPFSSCPFFPLKHSGCHLTPPWVIFLERSKPPFSLFLIWLQPRIPWPHYRGSLSGLLYSLSISGWAGVQRENIPLQQVCKYLTWHHQMMHKSKVDTHHGMQYISPNLYPHMGRKRKFG